MLLKEIQDKGAVVAWSPLAERTNVIATATKEGGGGGFDDYGGQIDLHEFDFNSSSQSAHKTVATMKTKCVGA